MSDSSTEPGVDNEAPTFKVPLKRERDTWGNYGQHSEETDYVRVGEGWTRCDDLPDARIDDQSGHSRKNEHTRILVVAQLPAGTLGKTITSEASSSRGTTKVEYWRVWEDGDRSWLGHTIRKVREGRLDLVYHDLGDGTAILRSRTPIGVRTNSYPGTCSCGASVPAEGGELYRDASGRWATRCVECFLKED